MHNLDEKIISLPLEGVKTTIVNYTYDSFELNTLLVLLSEKRRIFSTCEGYKEVNCIGNMYINGELSERERIKFENGVNVNFQLELMKNLARFLNLSFEDSAFLTTAVTMEHAAVCEKSFEEFKVICLATAGVKNNALRMGADGGDWVERKGVYQNVLGTINIILLTNVNLTDGAMARAVITATEAKTAALQDFDVRSTLTPKKQATGTGTDDVIIVSGPKIGEPIQCTKGHTKMGELIAASTKNAVAEAMKKHDRSLALRALLRKY
ncbi:MAG: adenosylcobinamide amidohydrolase [Candidatus Bathyarchaeia archaeon]|jgi:adenosylcobinamide amidohydrolase